MFAKIIKECFFPQLMGTKNKVITFAAGSAEMEGEYAITEYYSR